MKDFKGKEINVGIDMHLEHWSVAIFVGNTHHKIFHQPPCAQTLYTYLSKHFPNGNYHSIYESGYFGYEPHRYLTELGIQNVIVNPADVAKKDKDKKRKDDKRDAIMLARALKGEDITPIYIPTFEQEADRKLVRYRTNDMRKRLAKAKQRIKNLLTKVGKKEPEHLSKSNWSKEYIDWLKSIDGLPESYSEVLKNLIEELEMVKQLWRRVNRSIVKLSRTPDYQQGVKLLRSLEGIGLLTAMSILTEVIDIHRFQNLNHLCGYVGLVPNTSSSGQREKIGGLTKRTSGELRRMLIQAAWVAKRKNPELLLTYEDLTQRMTGSEAIVRITRKLLSRIRRVLIDQHPLGMD